MGNRYELSSMKCAYCDKETWDEGQWQDKAIYYAESSGVTTHTCRHCKKENKIVMGFHLTRV